MHAMKNYARLAFAISLLASANALASTVTKYTQRHVGSANFTSPENMVGAEDNVCAAAVPPMSGLEAASFDLFQFNLGPEATSIDGITVEVKNGASENCWGVVQLISYSSPFSISTTGDTKSFAGSLTTDCADTEWFAVGGEGDTWNVPVALTRDIVNDANFGVQIRRVCSFGEPMLVDAVRITVHYNVPTTTTTTTDPGSTTTTDPGSTTTTTPTTSTTTSTTLDDAHCPLAPSPSCTSAEKSLVQFKRQSGKPDKNRFMWKWTQGGETSLAAFGTPTTDTASDFLVCVYDGAGARIIDAEVPGGSAAWKALRMSGFAFKGDADGISQMTLKAGAAGKASITVKGEGADLTIPALPPVQAPGPLAVRVHSVSSGACFGGTYSAPARTKTNNTTNFKDVGD